MKRDTLNLMVLDFIFKSQMKLLFVKLLDIYRVFQEE